MILIGILRKFLYDPRIKTLDVDDPELLKIHLAVLQEKVLLRSAFCSFYNVMLKCRKIFVTATGPELELGSGVSFFKFIHPKIITSDIRQGKNIDKFINAQKMKVRRNSLSCIYAINVFHHLDNPDLFFKEINRVLKPGGACILIEPHGGFFSALIHKFMHKDETYNKKQGKWKSNSISGPLSGANQALAFIVFKRDLQLFKKKYGKFLEITHQEYIKNGLRYFLSGGLNFRQIVPSFMCPILSILEIALSPIEKYWTLHEVTVILKKS